MGRNRLNRKKLNRRKHESGISLPIALAMIIFLAIATSASISAFEWLRDFCLSRTYIREIAVKGNQRISSEDILGISRLRVGIDNVCSIIPHIVEKRIKTQSRYLERVSVQRRFAREGKARLRAWVTIEVKEREPLALVKSETGADSFIVIDDHGFILEKVEPGMKPVCISPNENMPVIVGVDADLLENSGRNEAGTSGIFAHPRSDLAADVLINARSIIPGLFHEISCVDARDPDNILLYLQRRVENVERGAKSVGPKAGSSVPHVLGTGFGTTIRLASDRVKEGLSNILPVIMKRREENKATKYIDARFPGAVYCGEGIHYEGRWQSG